MTSKIMRIGTAAALIMTLAFALPGFCVEWRSTNQATIAWDAVTTLDDGSALPAGHTVKYRVYLSNAVTDPEKSNPALLGETDQLEYTITLNTEGKYYAGVQSVRYDENTVEVGTSVINWSDTNGEMTPNPFGLIHYLPPAAPVNLR
jgi:hypothetical protein